MRFAVVLLLLLVACGTSNPAATLNGTWNMSTGGVMVIDLDAGRILINDIPGEFKVDRTEGQSVYLSGMGMKEPLQIQLSNNNEAVWQPGKDNEITLTRRQELP